ncbi:MAG: CAP domain-containing protein [Chloroflexi bacterium]|nr:CAP domain-containing protein [Chloroflexota bacterium]
MKTVGLFLSIALFLSAGFPQPEAVAAVPLRQTTITAPSQLIEVVNALRLSNGLPALAVHPALMQSAQSQADYMAATGLITHARPGGITFTQQLLDLGFPLAGEIRSENILNSGAPLVWNGVPPVWQDAAHMNTMLSASYTHIGAGVSQGAGGYYYALDCAAASASGGAQSATSAGTPASGGAPAVSQYIAPIIVSTARPDGNVYHILQNGQTLWGVAIAYGTTIKEIQNLNGLGDDLVVWQGQELLVKRGATQPSSPSPTPPPATSTPPPSLTPTSPPPSPTVVYQTIAPTAAADGTTLPSSGVLVGVLVFAALLGGAMAVWLIREPK